MKFILVLIFTFFISSCVKNNKIFVCGDHECVNNKEMKEFFAKNLYIEVITEKKNKDGYIDLVQLNTGINEKKIQNDNYKNQDIRKLNKQEKKEQISERKKATKLEKIRKKELKKEQKKAKKLAKLNQQKIKIDKKNTSKTQKIITNNTFKRDASVKKIIRASDYCIDLKNCDIDQISELIIKNSRIKNYPKINTK